MAARIQPHHQEDVRRKIQAIKYIQLLGEHAEGKREMTATQIQAARILLDKSMSNAPTVIAGDANAPISIEIVKFSEAK